MLFRFECYGGDEHLIHIPDSVSWSIVQENMDRGREILLRYDGKEICLRDADSYCDGRQITDSAIAEYFTSIIDKIKELLTADVSPRCICLEEIEGQLLEEKYVELWLEKGYISLDERGYW